MQALMNQVTEGYRRVLSDALCGIYLHGSLAFGCFNPQQSDIDFLAVVRRPLTQKEKEGLIRLLLDLTPAAPPKGFEMSVVLRSVCRSFVYPTPFELHFSNTYREKAMADLTWFCAHAFDGVLDPDLAAHFTVILHTGIVFWGEPIAKVFFEVPWMAYLDSIRLDVRNAAEQLAKNPVYIILNLCRVAAALFDGLVLSKQGGGRWGLAHLPPSYVPLIQQALDAYASDSPSVSFPVTETAVQFCEEMEARILGK